MSQLTLAVVGADYPNPKKGFNRRTEILLCVPGEPVDLVPEPKNPADPRAIAVYSARGIQIGYVRAERAQLVGSYLSRGRVTSVIFQEATDYGATIRLGLDGEEPVLPPAQPRAPKPEGSGFWPDYIPPDE